MYQCLVIFKRGSFSDLLANSTNDINIVQCILEHLLLHEKWFVLFVLRDSYTQMHLLTPVGNVVPQCASPFTIIKLHRHDVGKNVTGLDLC